jgi:hypothetical protein
MSIFVDKQHKMYIHLCNDKMYHCKVSQWDDDDKIWLIGNCSRCKRLICRFTVVDYVVVVGASCYISLHAIILSSANAAGAYICSLKLLLTLLLQICGIRFVIQ